MIALVSAFFVFQLCFKKVAEKAQFLVSNWVEIVNWDTMAVAFVEKVFPLTRLRAQSGLIHCNSRWRCVGSPQSVFLEVLGTKKKQCFWSKKKNCLGSFNKNAFLERVCRISICHALCYFLPAFENFELAKNAGWTLKVFWLFFTKACRFSANLFRSVLLGD